METYPRAAAERAKKIQEVILRAVAKKITWTQAGEISGCAVFIASPAKEMVGAIVDDLASRTSLRCTSISMSREPRLRDTLS